MRFCNEASESWGSHLVENGCVCRANARLGVKRRRGRQAQRPPLGPPQNLRLVTVTEELVGILFADGARVLGDRGHRGTA